MDWKQQDIAELERQHALGYEKHPQTEEEASEWKSEQVWCEYEPEETERERQRGQGRD
jgi:hypothetical protein